MIHTRILLPLLVLFATSNLPAQSNNQVSKTLYPKDLAATIAGSKKTYLELIRQVLPDLKMSDTDPDVAMAHTTVPFKHLSEDAKPAVLEGDLKLDSFQPQWINSEGRRILLLELDVSSENANQGMNYEGEATFLAAFNTAPAMKLLEVMDIKTDRFTGFWETPAVFRLTARTDSFLVYSEHSNAGESFVDLTMLFLNHNRFEIITNLFIFNTQGCGVGFIETPHFRILPGGSQKYPKIAVNVVVKKEPDPPECDHRTRGYSWNYSMVYVWDSTKSEYKTNSRQMEALDKFNRDRN